METKLIDRKKELEDKYGVGILDTPLKDCPKELKDKLMKDFRYVGKSVLNMSFPDPEIVHNH